MRVAVIGKNYIIKDTLPKIINDDYWILDDKEESYNKLINIKMNNGKYTMISSDYSKIIDKSYLSLIDNRHSISKPIGSFLQEVVLEVNGIYPMLINDSNEISIVYCLPDYENGFVHLDLVNTREITIGSSSDNNIVYKNPLIANFHARIYKNNDNSWTLENLDPKFGVFVNHYPVYENLKDIFNGDIIFIMGLEIIIIKNTIYINNPNNNVYLDRKYFKSSDIEEKIKEVNSNKQNRKVKVNNKIEYFFRSPSMIPPIKTETLTIDEPPDQRDDGKTPWLLMMGSSLIMGVMMLTSVVSTIQDITSGTASTLDIVMGIISTLVLILAMVVLPVMEEKWNKRENKKYEINRQKKYKQYLINKNEFINEVKNTQRNTLYQTFLSIEQCAEAINKKSPRLWERKIEDDTFLSVRLGLGEVPLQMEISYPEERFAMEEDSLLKELNNLVANAKTIDNCPITVSFAKNTISALVSNNYELTRKYMRNIILQLITFHSYEDLKLVFLVDKKNSKDWEYVKMLPHVWDDFKQVRFFADNYDDMNELSKYLLEELSNRAENEHNERDYKEFSPYYLIITDNYKLIENLNFITEFSEMKSNVGFSMLCLTDDLYSLPSECKTFIDIRNSPKGILYEKDIDEIKQTDMKMEPIVTIFTEEIAQKISNIPIREKKGELSLPKSFSFLEMYEVGNIEQLDILKRWKTNDSTLSLKAPIGIDSSGMIISLDAHEKYHGPHGLIAGSTGSGKSEFIITYILSLALNFHPYDVSFLLIDYKGGGLAGAFQKNNIKLPHLVGTITNIDKSGLNRSLTSIQSELRRREIMFNEARNISNEGTIDIYKYQKLYHDGVVDKPIPHLFIICDEFAELKQQQPDFMNELISVSRIGRSLGVHLILATQKPNGIVDDQIRSNSKFGICLKVQDVIDSKDVILRPDAVNLKNPGQFYMKVGHNEYFTLGQSGWAGAPYIPSNVPVKKIDDSVEFISNIGRPIRKINDVENKNNVAVGEQLTCIFNYICELAKQEEITTSNLWLDAIPADIYLNDLRNKYKVKNGIDVDVVIGEYDDPYNQRQDLVKLNLSKRDNIIIYGNAESGKETVLSTIIYDTITSYTSEQAQIYILDFGTEALKIYKDSPHVGDTIFIGQDDKIKVFFDMIQRIIAERKQILSECNGDYNLYIKKGNVMPIVMIVINNYEVFDENYGSLYDDLFLTLTRDGAKCGVVFIVTASTTSAMRYRLTANFNKKIALLLNDESDYYSIFDRVGSLRPTHMFGRGLVSIDNAIYEFQTARICGNAEYNEYIHEKIDMLNDKGMIKAPPVPSLPDVVEIESVESYLNGLSKVPIGLNKSNLAVHTYDFLNNFMTIISSKDIINAIDFVNGILQVINNLDNVKVIILNSGDEDGMKKAYKNFVKSIKNDIKNDEDMYTLGVIVGIDNFISEEIFDEFEFNELLEDAKNNEKHSFIIIEKPELMEQHSYESWYSDNIQNNNGIWVGNGIENQTIISYEFSMSGLENKCGKSFGYAVEDGNPTLVKLIGIEEETEDE